MAFSVRRAGLTAAALICAAPCLAQGQIDYSVLLSPQLAGVHSTFELAPLSPFAYPPWNNPELVGRFYGRLDVRPSFTTDTGRFGLDVGLYSNLNTAYDHRRGIVQFDRRNLMLTRIRPETPLDFDRLQLFYETTFGRFEAGWGNGASDRLAVTAPMRWGVGSVGGDYPYFVDKPIDVGFVSLTPYGSANTSPRVAYYTPPFHGVQVGMSYQPDTRNTGFAFEYGGREFGLLGRRSALDGSLSFGGNVTPMANPRGIINSFEGHTVGFTDVVEGVIRAEHRVFGDFRVAASLGGIFGSAVQSPTLTRFNDLRSFQAGLQVGWGGFSVGGGYVFAGDSGYTTAAHWRQRKTQYSAHIGAQYETGPWTVGATALIADDAGDPTERSDRQLHVYSAGLRYQVNQQLDVGGELTMVRPLSADFGDHNVYMGLVQLRYRIGGTVR